MNHEYIYYVFHVETIKLIELMTFEIISMSSKRSFHEDILAVDDYLFTLGPDEAPVH